MSQESVVETCEYESSLPLYATIIYGILTLIILVTVTIYGFYNKHKNNSLNNSDIPTIFCDWLELISVYVTITTHIFDQASDIAVIYEFGLLTTNNIKCVNYITGDTIKVYQFFYASIAPLIAYRFVSSIWVYYVSKKFYRLALQLFDLEIFRSIYITCLLNINKRTPPQKILSIFEAILEAMPQLFIQTSFLLQTGKYHNFLLVTSIIMGVFVIFLKLIDDYDYMLFKSIYNGTGFGAEFGGHVSKPCKNNILYILRIIFRWLNITSVLFLYTLIYSLGYGYIALMIIALNVVIHIMILIFNDGIELSLPFYYIFG